MTAPTHAIIAVSGGRHLFACFSTSWTHSVTRFGSTLSITGIEDGAEVTVALSGTSLVTAVGQFRTKYVFLAPPDYPVSFVDIVQPMGAQVKLDGQDATGPLTAIASGFGVRRVALANTNGGAHVLTSDEPVGIQVLGYGGYTSYQYPGGLNQPGRNRPTPATGRLTNGRAVDLARVLLPPCSSIGSSAGAATRSSPSPTMSAGPSTWCATSACGQR